MSDLQYVEYAEMALLGNVIGDVYAFKEAAAFVGVTDFMFIKHRHIWEALQDMYDATIDVDNITLCAELQRRGHLHELENGAYITKLVNSVPNFMHVKSYAKMVRDYATERNLFDLANKIAQVANDQSMPIMDRATEIDKHYRESTMRHRSSAVRSGRAIMDQIWRNFEDRTFNPATVRGFTSGIDKLDQILMGFRPGLYAIGGASSMGKSTFAGGLVYNFAKQGRIVFVPTEMEGTRALEKIACDLAGIPYKKYLSGFLNHDEGGRFVEAFAKLADVQDNITVIDTDRPSMREIEAEVMRQQAQCLLVDSGSSMAMQVMGAGKSKESQVMVKDIRIGTTILCQQLQNVARSGVCVVALWQTGRNSKERSNKEPRINDFKEAGAIEETADVCIGLYRHDYYLSRQEAKPDPEKYPAGTARILILKDRDGGSGEDYVTVGFRPGHGFTAHVDPKLNGVNGR